MTGGSLGSTTLLSQPPVPPSESLALGQRFVQEARPPPLTKSSLFTFGTRPSSTIAPAVSATQQPGTFAFGEEFSKALPAFAPKPSQPQQNVTDASAESVFTVGISPPKAQAGRRVLRARRRGQRDPSVEASPPAQSSVREARPLHPLNPPVFGFGARPSGTTAPAAHATRNPGAFSFWEEFAKVLPTFAPKPSRQPQHAPAPVRSCVRTRRPAPLTEFAGPQQHRFGLATSALYST